MVSQGSKVECDCMKKTETVRERERERLYTVDTVGLFSVHHGFITWGSDPVFSIMFR